MRRILVTLAMLGVCLLLAGCLTFEQTMRIQEDGSVLASYVYTYQEANETVIKACLASALASVQMKDTPVDFLNEQGIARFCTEQGLELRQYRKNTKDGRTTVQIIILARRNAPEKLLALGGFVQTKNEMRVVLPEIGWPENMKGTISSLCPDLALSLTIVAPGRITETNGKTLRPDTANWIFTPQEGLFAKQQDLFVKW